MVSSSATCLVPEDLQCNVQLIARFSRQSGRAKTQKIKKRGMLIDENFMPKKESRA